MNIFENLVEQFLTVDGRVFVCPQYNIEWNSDLKEGGASPDFVALDLSPDPREVVIVEVATGSTLSGLFGRVEGREARWYRPLKQKMIEDRIIDSSWTFRFLGFVRRTNVEAAQRHFAAATDVKFYPLEDATFPWAYWESRIREGLPR
jgi:hypothetical protein